MPELSTLLVFAGAGLLLIAVPGPNLIYIAARSLGDGRRAGLVSALGVETGTLLHVAAAAAGLSALVASSATAFAAVKYLGAAYLVYLGLRALLRREAPAATERPDSAPLWPTYRQGVVVQVLNPKVALFFLAFLPQFVDPARGSIAGQILVLGAVLTALGLLVDSLYAVAAGAIGARTRRRAGGARFGRRLTAAVYLALGATAAFSGSSRARSA